MVSIEVVSPLHALQIKMILHPPLFEEGGVCDTIITHRLLGF